MCEREPAWEEALRTGQKYNIINMPFNISTEAPFYKSDDAFHGISYMYIFFQLSETSDWIFTL